MTIKVLVVDDQALLRAAFSSLIDAEDDLEVSGEAADGRQAVDLAASLNPDVVLMDVRMPVMDGIEATRQITAGQAGTAPRVLILTTFDLDEYVFEALRAGASGFALKSRPLEELLSAIRTVAAGEALLAPSVTRRLIAHFTEGDRVPRRTLSGLDELTEREREVLSLVARGLSNAELTETLHVSLPTVKTHVSRILTKLGARDRTQLVVLAYESGLVATALARPSSPGTTPKMIRAPDDSPSAARPAWHSMNTNDLLALGGVHGDHIGIGPILLVLLVLGGLAYGVTRRRQRPSTKPDPPFPSANPPLPRPDTSPKNGDWAVETHGLTKRFGTTVAVDDVELLVPRGSAFGYLGPNGAGKTTLIRTLLGLTKANRGTMSLLGTPVPAERSRALTRVAAIVDEPRFHAHLTGRDNLRLLAAARGGAAAERIAPSLARVGLAERAGDKVASYSMGMRQRLGVAACLLADPELLILDEPMNGLDPAGMHEMRAMIVSLVAEGRTVVLSSHLLDEVERTCDAVAIVDHGRVIRQGPIDELTRGAGGVVVQVDCAEPVRAAQLITEAGIAAGTALTDTGLTVTLPPGATLHDIAGLTRFLVRADIDVYGLREIQTSLEDWFLSVTSRLGESS